ncbi:HPr family phosphocarrier protein [Domibacillus sp. A3M-37]|nr:HPr family phosphocarrier protein [Domibacillus sp. A3M-37]
MVHKTFSIADKAGIHAHLASMLVPTASKFNSEISSPYLFSR